MRKCNGDEVVFLILDDAPGEGSRVVRIFENRHDAMAYLKKNPRFRGESHTVTRRTKAATADA